MWSDDIARSADRRWAARLWVESTGGRGVEFHIRGEWVIFDVLDAHEIGRAPYAYTGDDAATSLELLPEADALVVRTHEHLPTGGSHVLSDVRLPLPPAPTPASVSVPHIAFTASEGELAIAIDSLRGRRGGAVELTRWVGDRGIAVLLDGEPESDVLARLALDEPARLELDGVATNIDEVNRYAGSQVLQVRIARKPSSSSAVKVRFGGRESTLEPTAIRDWIYVPVGDAEHARLARLARFPLPASLARV